MSKTQLSGMLGNKTINVGETWESPGADNSGVVIGFNSKNQPIVEILEDTNSYTKGDLDILSNIFWVKRLPKQKVYIYYNSRYGKFIANRTEIKDPDSSVKLLEVREYNIEDLK